MWFEITKMLIAVEERNFSMSFSSLLKCVSRAAAEHAALLGGVTDSTERCESARVCKCSV